MTKTMSRVEQIEQRFRTTVTVLGDDEPNRRYHFKVGSMRVIIERFGRQTAEHAPTDLKGRIGGPDTWVVCVYGPTEDYPPAYMTGFAAALAEAENQTRLAAA